MSIIVDLSVHDSTLRETTWLQETVSASAFGEQRPACGVGGMEKASLERGDRAQSPETGTWLERRAGVHEGTMQTKNSFM